ncbi:MAG: hypothetical protein FWE11_02445 [Defluviitaleaceae bacterium]|nr:hypothetical protein [Defluviitaleaceae bacterium]
MTIKTVEELYRDDTKPDIISLGVVNGLQYNFKWLINHYQFLSGINPASYAEEDMTRVVKRLKSQHKRVMQLIKSSQ